MAANGGRVRKADIVFLGGLIGLVVEFVLHHDSPNAIWLAIFTPAVGLAPYVRAVDYVRSETGRSSPTGSSGPVQSSPHGGGTGD